MVKFTFPVRVESNWGEDHDLSVQGIYWYVYKVCSCIYCVRMEITKVLWFCMCVCRSLITNYRINTPCKTKYESANHIIHQQVNVH